MTTPPTPIRASLLRPVATAAMVVILLGAVGIALLRFTFVGPLLGIWTLKPPHEIDTAARLILAGTLKPDPSGMVTLSPDVARATFDGKAYITMPLNSTSSVIVFKVAQGKGSNFRGYLYSSAKLPDGLIQLSPFGGGSTLHGFPVTNETINIQSLGGAWYSAFSDWD